MTQHRRKKARTATVQQNDQSYEPDQNQQLQPVVANKEPTVAQLEAHFDVLAIKAFSEKVKEGKLKYLKHFNALGAVSGSAGQKARVKCTYNDCGRCLTYFVKDGTTSNLREHLKGIHKVEVASEAQQIQQQQKVTQVKYEEVPYEIYAPERLDIIRRMLVHIIKSKLPLNHCTDENYHHVLEREGIRFNCPSRFWVTFQGLPALYKKTKQRLAKKLQNVKWMVAITTDGWQNCTHQGFITLTGRYIVQGKDGLVLHEKLLDFKSYTGSQTGEQVLTQLHSQVKQAGLYYNKNFPIFLTSDRGSNIQLAVKLASGSIRGIPCFSHVIHRAVLKSMEVAEANLAVNKVVKLATQFNKSVPRHSAFAKWQRSRSGSKALNFITVSKTRWHGYLDSMMRQLHLQDTMLTWVNTCADPDLNLQPLRDNVLTESEITDIMALCYVLLHIRPMDSIAQATSQSSGVKYARIINATLERLEDLTQEVETEKVAAFDRGKAVMQSLQNRDKVIVRAFAGILQEQIQIRFVLEQMQYGILVLSYFDPYWQCDVPYWVLPKKGYRDLKETIKKTVHREIVNMWIGYKNFRNNDCPAEGQTAGGAGIQVSPNADGSERCYNNSSHNSCEGRQPDGGLNLQSRYYIDSGVLVQCSQESENKTHKVTQRKEQLLDHSMFASYVKETVVDANQLVTEEAREIAEEMKKYEDDRENIRANQDYLDPLVYWSAKAGQYPCLFQLALKMMSVPATSVLSEQTFSGAGRISTKERSLLSARTIEQLVYLQRTMTKADAAELTAEDFQVERNAMVQAKREKTRHAAFEKALEMHSSREEAYTAAQQAMEDVGEGTDDNLYYPGKSSYSAQDVLGADEQTRDIDAVLEEVFDRYDDASDFEDECQSMARKYKYVTGNVWKSWSKKKQDEWLAGGVD